MHLVDIKNGIMGTSAIVGGAMPIAIGAALASQMKNDKRVSVVFFGDGAVDEGAFHESLNFAALKRLPAIFICENNFYATNSPLLARQPADNIFKRAKPYMISGIRSDGNDIIKVYKSAKDAIESARRGNGPALIEYRTYRYKQHVGTRYDHEVGYRPKEELDRWIKNCPIKRFKNFLLKNNLISLDKIERIQAHIDREIEEAVVFAKNSRFPDKDELLEDVY